METTVEAPAVSEARGAVRVGHADPGIPELIEAQTRLAEIVEEAGAEQAASQ